MATSPQTPKEPSSDPAAEAMAADKSHKVVAAPTGDDPIAAVAAALGLDPQKAAAVFEMAKAAVGASSSAEVAALRQELADVRDNANAPKPGADGSVKDSNNASLGGMPWMYYRLPPTWPDEQRRGWIVIGPGGQRPRDGSRMINLFAHYLQKGMQPITQYGPCPVPTSVFLAEDFKTFVLRGGWKEFPASQIVAYNWHIKNPFAKLGIRFPQVEEIRDQLKVMVCEACGLRRDFMLDDLTIGDVYRMHLTNGHRYPFKDAIEAVKKAGWSVTPYAPHSIDDIIKARRPDELPLEPVV